MINKIFDETFLKIMKDFKNSDFPQERKMYLDIITIMKESYDKFLKVGEYEETKEWLIKEVKEYKIYPKL